MNEGGQAFPGFSSTSGRGSAKQNSQGEWENYETGMTLRDYFAAKAMQGILTFDSSGLKIESVPPKIARGAYTIADAMIAERDKEQK